MSLTVLYRLSDNGYAKEKFAFATKRYCLENFLKSFPASETHLMVDNTNLKDETYKWLTELHAKENFAKFFLYTGGSSAASWRAAFNLATNQLNGIPKDMDSPDIVAKYNLHLPDDALIYFVEDDYLHRLGSRTILLEGLDLASYVSLYDHKDKYIPAAMGGNKYIGDDATEETRVGLSKNSHWKLTNSTTMTFATSVKVLKEDEAIWKKWTLGQYPHDFNAFIELRQKGRSLITPIPGWSTHCEPKWSAPLIDWEKI